MSKIQLSWKQHFSDLFSDQQNCDNYFANLPCTTVFNSWEWLSTAANHLAETDRQLRLLVAHRGSRLVALLPFSVGREKIYGISVRTLRLLGDPLADQYPLPTGDMETLTMMLDAISTSDGNWDVVILSEIPEGLCGDETLQRWIAQSAKHYYRRHCSRAPVLNIKGQPLESIQNSYSRSLRTRLKRSRKKIGMADSILVEHHLPESHEVEELLKQIKAVEDLSWKGEAGTGIFSTRQKYQFFLDLSQKLARKHMLDIRLLRLDGQLISYRFGFRFQNSFFDYNLAYLPEFNKLSPGRILLDEIINRSVQDGLDSVDASRGSLQTGHLLGDWPTDFRDHFQWWLFTKSLRGLLLYGAVCYLKPLARSFLDKIMQARCLFHVNKGRI